MSNLERKHAPLRELKFAGDEASMTFTGYASVFGNIDDYGDVVEPGAFADTLEEWKARDMMPAMLLNHDAFDLPVGVWSAMEEDSYGLKVSGHLASTARGQEAYALLKMQPRPAISGLSIGFMTRASVAGDGASVVRRRLTSVSLFEISLVTFPANDLARVDAVKSLSGMSERELERRLMRDARLCKRDAMAIVSAVKSRGWPGREDGQFDAVEAALRRNIAAMAGR